MKTLNKLAVATTLIIGAVSGAQAQVWTDANSKYYSDYLNNKDVLSGITGKAYGDFEGAWNSGYTGKGVTITTVGKTSGIAGIWGTVDASAFVVKELAPGAVSNAANFDGRFGLNTATKNVLNVQAGYNVKNSDWTGWYTPFGIQNHPDWFLNSAALTSLNYSNNPNVIIVKNIGSSGQYNGTVLGNYNSGGANYVDTLNWEFAEKIKTGKGGNIIFAQALDANQMSVAKGINIAGSNAAVLSRTLGVVVTDAQMTAMGLSGDKSIGAANIISAAAAITQNKFSNANSLQIVDRLMTTSDRSKVLDWRNDRLGNLNLKGALAANAIR